MPVVTSDTSCQLRLPGTSSALIIHLETHRGSVGGHSNERTQAGISWDRVQESSRVEHPVCGVMGSANSSSIIVGWYHQRGTLRSPGAQSFHQGSVTQT
jgi:hypothetical protein